MQLNRSREPHSEQIKSAQNFWKLNEIKKIYDSNKKLILIKEPFKSVTLLVTVAEDVSGEGGKIPNGAVTIGASGTIASRLLIGWNVQPRISRRLLFTKHQSIYIKIKQTYLI